MPRVLVYHRFAPPGANIPHRVSADQFAWQLDQMRGKFNLLSLSACFDHFERHGRWPERAVVLTIDDGYRDMYRWAFPELLKRGVPATFFVTTRFIDGELLLWPDRLECAVHATLRECVTLQVAGREQTFILDGPLEKFAAWKAFSDYCISVPNAERERFIDEVEALLQVLPPAAQPSAYEASNWDEIREMHRGGIEIGSHTTSHPILSKIDPLLLDAEIARSKKVIEEQLSAAVESFCYPNSAPADINDDVISAVRAAGFKCAVFGTDLFRWEPYRIPRMGITNDRVDFLWKVYGGEMGNKRDYKG